MIVIAGIDATSAVALLQGPVGVPLGPHRTKDAAMSEAMPRWPDKAYQSAKRKDDGRAEAVLIAVAGILKDGRC